MVGTLNAASHNLYDGMMKNDIQMTPPEETNIQNCLGSKGTELVADWIEVWDYTDGARFRGFTTYESEEGGKSMFIFFDAFVIGKDLKQAYVSTCSYCLTRYWELLIWTQAYGAY